MITYETKKVLMDFILLGLCYALIFTMLTFFVYPIDLASFRTFEELITRSLGSAFFFGAISGLFTGLIGSMWVNRLDFKSSITMGLFTGMLTAIIGAIFFPPLGAFVRIFYFGINPADYNLEISFLINYSLLGVFPGILAGLISGILGGMATSAIGHVSSS